MEGMSKGMAMMLKSMLGIEPDEIQRQVQEAAKLAFDFLVSIDKRLAEIQTTQALHLGEIKEQLARIERNGLPIFASESLLAEFYSEAGNSVQDFLRLQGLEENHDGDTGTETAEGSEKLN